MGINQPGIRAKTAAEEVNRLRNWKRTRERFEENKARIKKDCWKFRRKVTPCSDGKWPPDRERENINRKQAVGDFKPNSLLFDMWWKKSLTGVSYVRNEGVSFLRILQLNSDSTVGRFLIRQLAEFCLGVWRKNPENRTLFQRIWGLKRTLF